MSANPGPTASPLKGAKRLVAEHVEQLVAVRHHLVFGMHVDPFSKGCIDRVVGAEALIYTPALGPDPVRSPAVRQAAGASS